MSIHPQVIEKNGKKEFVVLPYDEYVAMQEALEDFEDLKVLREAKAQTQSEPAVALSSIREELLTD